MKKNPVDMLFHRADDIPALQVLELDTWFQFEPADMNTPGAMYCWIVGTRKVICDCLSHAHKSHRQSRQIQ